MNKSLLALLLAFTAGNVSLTLGVVGLVYTWPIFLPILLLSLGILFLTFVFFQLLAYRKIATELENNLQKMCQGELTPPPPSMRHIPANVRRLSEAIDELGHQMETILSDRESANKLQEIILSGLDQGIVVLNNEGEVLLETPLARKMLQGNGPNNYIGDDPNHLNEASNEELLQYPFYMRGVNSNRLWEMMQSAMETGLPDTRLMNLSAQNEIRYIEVFTKPIETEETEGVLAVLRDVTRVKQLERMREDFVTNVTHELKTPMTSIKGYVELLRSAPRSPEDQDSFLEIIEIETDRLQNLISDILELSEIQDGDGQRAKDELVHVYQIAEQTFSDVRPMAEKADVALRLEMDSEFTLRANQARIRLLLSNLVTNAIKYNKPGGSVTISGHEERTRRVLQVNDTGIGMEKSELPRIFERFYRVSRSRSKDVAGTGLGLAIVKHTVSLFGGSIQVDSKPGEGSSFTIIFPK